MVLLPNGNVLAAGGTSNTIGILASTEVYNPSTATWTATTSLANARTDFQMVLLPNGKVLAAGRFNDGNTNGLASAEVYNPTTATWTVTARSSFQMVLLATDNVIAAGGLGPLGILASAEVHDTTISFWTTTDSLDIARYSFQMVLLLNGNVLAAGGNSNSNGFGPMASAEVYNPSIATWTATTSLTNARANFQNVVLPTRNVLAAGGYIISGAGTYLASAELYDPTTAAWTTTTSLAGARGLFQMTVF